MFNHTFLKSPKNSLCLTFETKHSSVILEFYIVSSTKDKTVKNILYNSIQVTIMCSYSYLDTILLWKYSIFDANFTCSTVGSQLSTLINVICLLCYYFIL